MKKGKTFLTLLSLAGIITVITMAVSNTMTTHLEKELALKVNNNLAKGPIPTPTVTILPTPVARPTLPPSPSPEEAQPTAEPTPVPTHKMLHLSLPATGAEVLADYTEDMLVFQATYGDYRAHLGIDFGGEKSTPVYAAADGTITKNEFDYEHGYTVEVTHQNGYLTRYCNLAGDRTVTVGQKVTQGEIIGAMGSSGIWEGHLPCHLHFELEQNGELLNPRNYLYTSMLQESVG